MFKRFIKNILFLGLLDSFSSFIILISLILSYLTNIRDRSTRSGAAIAAEHAYYLSNKDITISNRIYGITCPRINIRILAGKPTRYRRVVVDLKVS